MKKLIIAIVVVIIVVASSIFLCIKNSQINDTLDAIEDKNVKQVFKDSTYQSKMIMAKWK